ncbi:hypothetical protein RvY_04039 [Ramazzottius varieornatus]|uniref:Cathepsin propeptide inhibitor domain-containing protein n=1 Tax=Ramazzottius varieornatus TaxID=947166 RepID=A0A1D1UQY2_RAMVA|nr:hypothetical protein RvY_04039 [Ramazzottius varieornatus]
MSSLSGGSSDADPNTGVPYDWEAYKKYANLNITADQDAHHKATFLKTVEMVKENQRQQREGKTRPDFIGMNLNTHAHLTPEEFAKGAFGLIQAQPLRNP